MGERLDRATVEQQTVVFQYATDDPACSERFMVSSKRERLKRLTRDLFHYNREEPVACV